MARVFTISFDFLKERHIAMVTVVEDQTNNTVYNIKLFNENLYSIIPDGKICFSAAEKALPAEVQNQSAEELFLSVKTALNNFLLQKRAAIVG
jgi:hypothetical protein